MLKETFFKKIFFNDPNMVLGMARQMIELGQLGMWWRGNGSETRLYAIH